MYFNLTDCTYLNNLKLQNTVFNFLKLHKVTFFHHGVTGVDEGGNAGFFGKDL